jgi:hypothetical protein
MKAPLLILKFAPGLEDSVGSRLFAINVETWKELREVLFLINLRYLHAYSGGRTGLAEPLF